MVAEAKTPSLSSRKAEVIEKGARGQGARDKLGQPRVPNSSRCSRGSVI